MRCNNDGNINSGLIKKGLVYIMSGEQFYIDNSDIEKLHNALVQAEAVVIGAGAGLSASAGFTYNGERFHKYFGDFEEKYGF